MNPSAPSCDCCMPTASSGPHRANLLPCFRACSFCVVFGLQEVISASRVQSGAIFGCWVFILLRCVGASADQFCTELACGADSSPGASRLGPTLVCHSVCKASASFWSSMCYCVSTLPGGPDSGLCAFIPAPGFNVAPTLAFLWPAVLLFICVVCELLQVDSERSSPAALTSDIALRAFSRPQGTMRHTFSLLCIL
jgi:hypothetical protein